MLWSMCSASPVRSGSEGGVRSSGSPSALLRQGIAGLLIVELLIQPWERLDKVSFGVVLAIGLLHLGVSLLARRSPLPRGALAFPLLFLLVVAIGSGFLSDRPAYSARYGLETFGAPAILYCSVLGLFRESGRRAWIRGIGLPLLVSLAVSSTVGFVVLLLGETDGAASDLRFHGGFYWYAEAARYLEVAIFLSLGVAFSIQRMGATRLQVLLGAGTIALGFAALVATKTKGAFAGFLCGGLTFGLLRGRWRLLGVALLLSGSAALVLPGLRTELAKFADFARLTEASISAPFRYRPHGWQFVIDTAGESPLWGHGPGGKLFRSRLVDEGRTVAELGDEVLIRFYGEEESRSRPIVDHAHNFVLQAYYEMGGLGVLGFAWFFGGFFWRLFRRWRELSRNERTLDVAVASAVVAVLVHGLVAHVYTDSTFLLLVLGMAGVELGRGEVGGTGKAT